MYTYTFKDQKQKANATKINALPNIQQPDHMFALPPLAFYLQASQPLDFAHYCKLKQQKQSIQQQIYNHQVELDGWRDKYNQLHQQHEQLAAQYDRLRNQYKQGEYLFRNMEDNCIKMKQQLEQLKAKKLDKSKISVGIKKKQKEIPIVKINMPNPKVLTQQTQKDSIYRQLKSASEELNHMRKVLESEKQKSQQMQNYLSKNIEQISIQRDNLKKQANYLKEQNRNLKDQLGKQKSTAFNTVKNVSIQSTNNQYQKIKMELERIQRVHKSCNVLLASKDNEVSLLKIEIEKLNDKIKSKNQGNQRPIFGFDQSRKISNSYVYEKQRSPKQFIDANTLLPQSSVKKDMYISFEGQSQENYTKILEQHLNLSLKQKRTVEQLIKGIVESFLNKIQQLKNELDWANKKAEHQRFELQRVYELLRDKKQQVDNCYKDLRNAGRNSKSTPVKQVQRDEEFLKSILKGRRDFSA